jgi:hypothetical protein
MARPSREIQQTNLHIYGADAPAIREIAAALFDFGDRPMRGDIAVQTDHPGSAMLPVVLEKNRLAASMSRRLFTMLPPALSRGAEPEAGENGRDQGDRFVGTIGNYPADVASVRAGTRI